MNDRNLNDDPGDFKKFAKIQEIISHQAQAVIGRFVDYTKVSQTTYITILASIIGILSGFGYFYKIDFLLSKFSNWQNR